GWLAYGGVDGTIRVLEVESGDLIADFTGERSPILAMAADREFTTLAIGDGYGFIKVIDSAKWVVTEDFRATLHGPVWALRFSADGRNIHAGSLDDAMYSWPVASLGEHERMTRGELSFLKDPAEMSNGERQFQRKCSICHALDPDGRRRAGPTLFGIFGRPAGRLVNYSYSPTLRNSDIIWDVGTIDALFDLGPDDFIPGSKMPMQRITKAADREDLIAFLRRATAASGGNR
ncbi:MAG: c-type cytochrome, partial [Rhodospirillales bacterium]|nr:c-type cytochrome [Rhodospirillales bacterium]